MSGALSWVNKVLDDADGAVSVGSASGTFVSNQIDSAFPGANAILPFPSLKTRVNFETGASAGDYQSYLESNWGTNSNIRVLAALNLYTGEETYGVQFQVLNAAGSVLETTPNVYPSIASPIEGTTDRYNLFCVLSATRSVNRVRLIFNYKEGYSGYYEVGTLWAGDALVFGAFDKDWSEEIVDNSVVERSESGGYAAYRHNVLRKLTVSKDLLNYQNAIGTNGNPAILSVRQAMLYAGKSSPVVVVTSDEDVHRAQSMSIYGLVENWNALQHAGGDRYGVGAKILEIR